MFDWYCKENVDYVENLISQGEVPVYWNDVDCYYWAPSVILPSGNVCDFFCYNNRYAPKHHPWDLTYKINPTLEQMEALEKAKKDADRPVSEEPEQESAPMQETSVLLGRCLRALRFLDTEHRKYFTDFP